jgi:GntR family transcriptional regulator
VGAHRALVAGRRPSTARDALRARRRETFFSDVVDAMVAEAKAVGIPVTEVIARIRHLAREGDR